jgi:rhodanese-related sulfurtransferase
MERIPTIDEVLERARARLERVRPEELESEMGAGALVVDVRTSEQRGRDGELPGAVPIDLTVLEWRLAPSSRHRELDFPPDRKVILVCSQGFSSSLAAARLKELGLARATDLDGGYTAWKSWKDGRDGPLALA